MKKYEFTGETKAIFGRTLRKIKAVVKFGIVEVGELGGWIEKEENLAHEGDAKVFGKSHLLAIGPIRSRSAYTTFYRDKDRKITVRCGCFLGKIDKLLEKVAQTHGDSKYTLVYKATVEVAKAHIDLSDEETEEISSGDIKETCCESDIFCPWCGEIYEIEDEFDLYDDGEHECQCPSCNKKFTVDTNVSYTFSTTRQEVEDE